MQYDLPNDLLLAQRLSKEFAGALQVRHRQALDLEIGIASSFTMSKWPYCKFHTHNFIEHHILHTVPKHAR